MPIPPPISSQSDRSRGVASAKRGNHTRGTDTTGPSDNVTDSASFENDASTASVGSPSTFHVQLDRLVEGLRLCVATAEGGDRRNVVAVFVSLHDHVELLRHDLILGQGCLAPPLAAPISQPVGRRGRVYTPTIQRAQLLLRPFRA